MNKLLPMPTKIILVRHGVSQWNDDSENDRYNGLTDIVLSENGIEQVKQMAVFLKNENISAFYSSPLQRALQTAQIVAEKHSQKQLSVVPEFLEINFGDWESFTRKQLSEKYGSEYVKWKENPAKIKPPNGENGISVKERALPKILELAQNHANQTIFIAAHKNVNKIILASLMGLELKHFRKYIPQRAGAVNVFHIKNGSLYKIDFIDNLKY
jgi:broad specificity phosphatase PhoE